MTTLFTKFDEGFQEENMGGSKDYLVADKEEVKSFFSSELKTAVEELRKKDLVTKMIHLKTQGISKTNRIRSRKKAETYNQALDDLLTKVGIKE